MSGEGANHHWYKFVVGKSIWETARTNALSNTYSDMTGYLATITSAQENTFLTTLDSSGWIGAIDQEDQGNWVWADGPEIGETFWQDGAQVDFSNWQNASMPDNGNSGDKDYTSLINGNGAWKNEQGTKTQGCFVEYSVSAVPVLVF